MIYFIQSQNGGRIKIGYSANVDRRLENIRGANAYPINVLHISEGSRGVEGEIHVALKDHRAHLEWFEPHDDVLALIDDLKTGKVLFPAEVLIEDSKYSRSLLMDEIAVKVSDLEISMLSLFQSAGLSATILHNWRKGSGSPSLATIGKLEKALKEMES